MAVSGEAHTSATVPDLKSAHASEEEGDAMPPSVPSAAGTADATHQGESAAGAYPPFVSPHTRGWVPGSLVATPGRYFITLTPRTQADYGGDFSAQLAMMRQQFPDRPDFDLAPYIRGADGNVQAAAKQYRETLAWRAKWIPVEKESCIGMLRKGMFYYRGVDREGRPVGYLTMRGHDPKNRDLDECLRAIVWRYERMAEAQPQKEFQVSIVIDRVGAGLKNQDMELIRTFISLFSDHYPCTLGRMYVAPANAIFRTLWAAIKYAVKPDHRSKMKLLGDVKGLQEFIAPDQLPEHLGGTDKFEPTDDL